MTGNGERSARWNAERTPERRQVASRIKEALLACGYRPTGTGTAAELGVARGTLGRWVAGTAFPRPEQMLKLAQLTSRPVAWFYQDLGPLPREQVQAALLELLEAAAAGADIGTALEAIVAPYGRIDPAVKAYAARVGEKLARELAAGASRGYAALSRDGRAAVVEEQVRRRDRGAVQQE